MRTAYGIYRGLQIYLETYANDPELDEHFKSGVQLGTGLSSLMLSLLPSKVMKVCHESFKPNRANSCEAACLAELQPVDEDKQDQAALNTMMAEVPRNLKKIAGKSLPIEKFVSRKARKFASQNHRLILPAIELSYFFGTLPNAPPRLQFGAILPRIESHINSLAQSTPESYNHGSGYWDDYCLAHFLRGVALSFAAYPHEEALITEEDYKAYPDGAKAAGEEAMGSFKHLLEHAIDIQLDHWIIYFTHYEMGRLYSQMGDNESAKHELELVMSGKTLEVNTQARSQGKYSMESALMIRVHAGLQAIKEDPRTRIH
ncbi:hypothetical protein QFC19_004052 [Naganishia cerealis]|uniref:Uncharacterized protein n=1 Tax=Naganishia cerealis TaxID=610337 RepID=A0ACC2VZC6_9TREE|nr:hypothetical protein QFC19_004052 [Naganishia cerealis]